MRLAPLLVASLLVGCTCGNPSPEGCPSPCGATQSCVASKCFDNDCASASCTDRQVCSSSACTDKKCIDKTCAGGELCADGVCLPTSCSSGPCAAGLVCANDRCIDPSCAGVTCPGAQLCAKGECLPVNCPSVSCDPGSVCFQSSCMNAPCVGVVCPGGATCRDGVCPSPMCSNGTRDGTETDVDCGGNGGCLRCGADAGCLMPSDCQSNTCGAGRCGTGSGPTCTDGIRNGNESDVDCGATPCPLCGADAGCTLNTHCASMVCGGNRCTGGSCSDGIKDNSESDIDCGGPFCAPCTTGACAVGDDCSSRICRAGQCTLASCTDGAKNALEVDVDCGGDGGCPACMGGLRCTAQAGCLGGVCDGGFCTGPSCHDGIRNGAETDIDCGGGSCAACGNTLSCSLDAGNRDCHYGLCQNGTCFVFTVRLPRWSPPDSKTRWCSPNGACPSDGGLEDGDRVAHVPTYTTTLEVVNDSVTGLTWQRTFGTTMRTWEEAWHACDGLVLGGYTDWRLPARVELFSLADLGREPAIDPVAFPGAATIPTSFFFWWTSSMFPTSPTSYRAMQVRFGQSLMGPPVAFSTVLVQSGATALFRCVRAPTVPLPTPRLQAYSGSVVDNVTGLQWEEPIASGMLNWAGAKSYCANLVASGPGFTDWRLPDLHELDTLAVEFATPYALDVLFQGTPTHVWSSTPRASTGSTSAFFYDFTSGGVSIDTDGVSAPHGVRCVRGGDAGT